MSSGTTRPRRSGSGQRVDRGVRPGVYPRVDACRPRRAARRERARRHSNGGSTGELLTLSDVKPPSIADTLPLCSATRKASSAVAKLGARMM